MPEGISKYISTEKLSDLPGIYESIWGTYKNDVEKYAKNETERRVIKHVINTAHLYIDKRIKFQKFGNSNYRSREVGEAMRNFDDAKIIQLIYPTTDVEIPIKPDLRKSPRIQVLDTGLVNYTLGIQTELLILKDLSRAYKGAIIPHLITQELMSLNRITNPKPNFWVREKNQASSEIDLVYAYKNYVIPIKIKSGMVGTLKSLQQFIEQSNHYYAIRIYVGEFIIEQTTTPSGARPRSSARRTTPTATPTATSPRAPRTCTAACSSCTAPTTTTSTRRTPCTSSTS
jgi:predicted AAA+ superfamily ATPase